VASADVGVEGDEPGSDEALPGVDDAVDGARVGFSCVFNLVIFHDDCSILEYPVLSSIEGDYVSAIDRGYQRNSSKRPVFSSIKNGLVTRGDQRSKGFYVRGVMVGVLAAA
jgi:hypothetical protein